MLVDVKAWGIAVIFHTQELSQYIHMGVTLST